ncbi:hypothetical protein Leryth_001641 [Lithospermum erythrorhizon]|nr:hypothetical protein Leryth_001641 [Lithospermum erythrorhizon]
MLKIFDIHDTLLSNLPYYTLADASFGDIPYSNPKFNEWMTEGSAPPLSGILYLYKNLTSFGIKSVFLSNIDEKYREVISSNLKAAGYTTWEKLILKGTSDPSDVVHYKSAKRTELVNAGYRILGNIGDQWTDLTGHHVGDRTFKVPNPMYCVA